MIPGDQYAVPVTLNNPTSAPWAAADWVLSYHWARADGTDVTTGGNQLDTPLPKDLAPGEAVTVNAAVKTPINSDEGNKRTQYLLRWELRNKTTGKWLSEATGIGTLDQPVTVEDPTSDELGLEKFYQYVGMGTGSGSGARVNLAAGNVVWNYDAFANPSRGLATSVRLSYNSLDTSGSSMGYGWSLSASTLTRLGSPVQFHPKPKDWPTEVSFTDGDGTSHVFKLDKHDSADPANWDYDAPAGVHLYLRPNPGGDASRAWVMTKPDRTQFFFDDEGYQTATADSNGNELLFTYEERRSNNKPTKFLRYLTDPAGRRTLSVNYYAKGDDYTYIDDSGAEVNDTGLTNPKIIDQVKSITDIDDRVITLTYTDKGLLAKMVDGAGSAQPKVFRFGYDATQGNKNIKLVSVTDPRGHAANLKYYDAPTDPKFKWWAQTLTNRLGNPTDFAYTDPDANTGSKIQTVVTDAERHASVHLMDGFGRPERITDAKGHVTELRWDADNNVVALKEANGATTSWLYDEKTGYPLELRDAEANAHGTAPTKLTYRTGLNVHVADLASSTSPEGRTTTFSYDAAGNLTSMTDPAGNATETPDDYTTTYAYDAFGQLASTTDANGHKTTFAVYDPTGSPKSTTDALGHTTVMALDARGNVVSVTDARGKTSTFGFDLFGRPLQSKTPKNAAADEYIVTPAPGYDANDNVLESTAPNGAKSTATYDSADELISETAPRDADSGPARVTTYEYDKLGNVIAETEPNGNLTPTVPNDFVTRYVYDEIYQLTTVTDAAGGKTTHSYDSVGNVVTVVDPVKNATADPDDYTTKYTYDLNHRVTAITDAAGHRRSTDYDRDGNVLAATDQEGNKSELTLDPRALVTEVKTPHANNGGTIEYHVMRYEYDQVGNRTKVISPRGVATADDPDDFAQVTVYDEMNRVKEQALPYDKDDGRYNTPDKVINTYDEIGNLIKVSAPPSAGQPVRNDTSYTYFDNGWIASSTDPWDIVNSYDYNPLGLQTLNKVTSAGGSSSRTKTWSYYPDGKLKGRNDDGVPVGQHVMLVDNGDNGASSLGSWETHSEGAGFQGYDYRTHPLGSGANDSFSWAAAVPLAGDYELFVKYPAVAGAATNATYLISDHKDGTATNIGEKTLDQTQHTGEWVSLGRYHFDEDHSINLSLLMNRGPNGTLVADAVKFVRDNSGEADPEAKSLGYGYDANGNLTSVTDTSSGALVDAYNVGYTTLNQIASVVEKAGDEDRHTTGYTYYPNGAPRTLTHDRRVTTYEYDVRDLIAKVTNPPSGTNPAPRVTSYSYTPRGQRAKETKANGNTVEYSYYLDGLLKGQTEKTGPGVLVGDHQITYDENGNRRTDSVKLMNADAHDRYLSPAYSYTYDPRDRIAQVTKSGDQVGQEQYIHDANNNVIEQNLNGVKTTHTYDRNRLVKTEGGEDNLAYATYTYDPFGRLEEARGLYQTLRYTYDGFDRIFELRQTNHPPNPSTTVTRYTYDPLDRTTRKVEQPSSASERTFDYDYLGMADLVAQEQDSFGAITSYEYGRSSERLAQIRASEDGALESAFYSYNPHTDVEAITDDTGNTRATYGYTAYGQNDDSLFTGVDKPDPNNPKKPPYNVYRFNAKPFDSASGNYDMGFRDYSPTQGRFLVRDSYGGAVADMGLTTDPWTMNRYAFGGGNPISSVEVDGHLPCWLSVSLTCPKPNLDANQDGYVTPGDLASSVWLSKCQGMPSWQGQAVCGGMAPGISAITDLFADLGPVPLNQAMRCQQGDGWGCFLTGLAFAGVLLDAGAVSAVSAAGRAGSTAAKATGAAGAVAKTTAVARTGAMASRHRWWVVRQLGNAGEQALKIPRKKTRIPSITGTAKYRIPDFIGRRVVLDVKNVAYLELTDQLLDFYDFAAKTNRAFAIIARQDTTLSLEMRNMQSLGLVKIYRWLPSIDI
jgi:RHS repeat-associated protein